MIVVYEVAGIGSVSDEVDVVIAVSVMDDKVDVVNCIDVCCCC